MHTCEYVHKAPEPTDDAVLSTSDQDHVKGKKEKKLRSSSPRTAGMREDCFCLFLDEESFSPLACLFIWQKHSASPNPALIPRGLARA